MYQPQARTSRTEQLRLTSDRKADALPRFSHHCRTSRFLWVILERDGLTHLADVYQTTTNGKRS